MIKINLLPFRKARRRENVRRQVNVYFLCLLFLFSLMGYFHFDLNASWRAGRPGKKVFKMN